MSQQSSHRTIAEYTVNSAPELDSAAYEVVCPLLPYHGKANMMRSACESRRGAAAKSEIKCACKHWPGCATYVEDTTDYLHRSVRTGLTNMVAEAILEGKTQEEIVEMTGLSSKQITRHRKIIAANPDLYPEFNADAAKEPDREIASVRAITPYARQIADRACELYKTGKSVKEIAERLCRSPRLIERRLKEEGVFLPPAGGPSKKVRAFEVWHKDPDVSEQQITDMFQLTQHTAAKYRRAFAREHRQVQSARDRVCDWLDHNLEATTRDVVKEFGLHLSTASEYRMKYRRSARYRNLTR